MDENTYLLITLIVMELMTLATTITGAVITFIKNEDDKLKKSKCCGGEIEYNN